MVTQEEHEQQKARELSTPVPERIQERLKDSEGERIKGEEKARTLLEVLVVGVTLGTALSAALIPGTPFSDYTPFQGALYATAIILLTLFMTRIIMQK